MTNVLITDIFWTEVSWDEKLGVYLTEIHMMAIFQSSEQRELYYEFILSLEWYQSVSASLVFPGALVHPQTQLK